MTRAGSAVVRSAPRMTSWGGPPYPHCTCGHPRIDHIGYAPPGLLNDSSLSTQRREGGCQKVVGTGWCKCSMYREAA